jgi:hypothetical protein
MGSPIGLPDPSSAAALTDLAPSMLRSFTVTVTGSIDVGTVALSAAAQPAVGAVPFLAAVGHARTRVEAHLVRPGHGLPSMEVNAMVATIRLNGTRRENSTMPDANRATPSVRSTAVRFSQGRHDIAL